MASFSLTIDEYKKANFSPIARPWKRRLACVIAGVVLVVSAVTCQYAFSVIWLALLAFLYVTFYRMAPRMEENKIRNNPFALGPFELELREASYSIRVGNTTLDLALSEFGLAHDFDTHYRLDHK